MKLFDNLDNLSRSFLAELERLVPREVFRTEFSDRLVVTIPARNQDVGDITVWLDADEVTVGIGQIHHTHFEVYAQSPSETLQEREQAAAERAAQFIHDFMDEKIRVQVQFEHGRCLGGGSWYPELSEPIALMLGADEVREYVWSRRIK